MRQNARMADHPGVSTSRILKPGGEDSNHPEGL